MGGRHIVERRGRPRANEGDSVEDGRDERCARVGVIRGLVEDGVVQPDDALSALLELRTFRRVRLKMMRLEVAVDESVRMADSRLVYVRRC